MESLKKPRKTEMAKTALDLSPFEWKRYHPFTTGGRRNSLLLTRGQDKARDVAGRIAQKLFKHFGAHRVVLFGSAA